MFRTLGIVSTVAVLSACQTTGSNVSVSQAPTEASVSSTLIMKDVRPRSVTHPRYWNDDMPHNSPWSFNVTNKVEPRAGKLSQRFELREGDCTVHPRLAQTGHDPNWGCFNDRERAEIWGKEYKPGREMFIGFSIMANNENKVMSRGHCTSVFQIKQMEHNVYQGNLAPISGIYASSPEEEKKYGGQYVGSHSYMNGVVCGNKVGLKFQRTGSTTKNKYKGWVKDEVVWITTLDNIKGEWIDIVIRQDTRGHRNEQSEVEVFINGKSVVTKTNLTSFFFPDVYVFKYGPYRGYMKANNGPNYKSATQVFYYDEIRFGNNYQSVAPDSNRAID